MANWCSFYMDIKCDSNENAEKLYDDYRLEQSVADEADVGMYIGTKNRYLFFSELDIHRNSVLVQGSVKWCIHPEEFEEMINYILERSGTNYVKLEYGELGCGEYGEFIYADNKITHKYIPYDVVVEELNKLGDGESCYQKLFKLMDTRAVTEVVKTYG